MEIKRKENENISKSKSVKRERVLDSPIGSTYVSEQTNIYGAIFAI